MKSVYLEIKSLNVRFGFLNTSVIAKWLGRVTLVLTSSSRFQKNQKEKKQKQEEEREEDDENKDKNMIKWFWK